MQPRRRSCVSVQPSVKSEPAEHFLKIILPSAIHANQMRIPEEFIRRFGDELSAIATIAVPDGCSWKMGLKRCGKNVWFCSNWQEFAKYYSISYGSVLVFKYEGDSNFRVLIFDITATEICYPCKTWVPNKRSRAEYQQHRAYETGNKKHRGENQVEISDVDNVSFPRKKRRSTSLGRQGKSRCNQNRTSRVSNSSSQRAKDAAIKLNQKNRSFVATIRRCAVYIPAEFAAKYLELKGSIKLQNSNGEQWDISCVSHGGTSRAMRLGTGWSKFAKENHVSEGDVCVFEVIKIRKLVVLKVTIPGAK